jgi:hypothetical protein
MTHRLPVRKHDRSDRSAKRERGTGRIGPANEARAHLGGNKPMEATATAYGAIPRRRWLAAVGEQSPGEAGPEPGQPVRGIWPLAKGQETSGGSWRIERSARRSSRSKASKGEPQTRDRDGISPAGLGGSNASRGCETLRAQPTCSDFGRGTSSRAAWEPRGDGAPPDREDAIGDRNLGRREVLATLWEQFQGRVRSSRRSSGKTLQGSQSLREENTCPDR